MNENILLELYEYTEKKYPGTELEKVVNRFEGFPYYLENIDPQNLIRDCMAWFVLEKVLPTTGKRLTESYVEDNPCLDEETKQKILNTKNVVASQFVVIAKDGLKLKLKDMKSEKYYDVVQISNSPQIQANTLILGKIFPWGNSYRFAGAMAIAHTPMIVDPDIMMHAYEKKMIERVEKTILSPSTNLTVVLNKYPFQWIDGICETLSLGTGGRKGEKVKDIAEKLTADLSEIIDKLPEKSKEALQFILDNGGFVKYGLLKEYDDEISWWWKEHPPTSSIGLLRVHGLVVVGKMPHGAKLFKTALVPKDVREELGKLLKQRDKED